MEFNINETVRVKLTPFGRRILREDDAKFWALHHPTFRKSTPYATPNEDKDGWSEWQLWHLMEKLGGYCHLGMTGQPFETNIEIIESR